MYGRFFFAVLRVLCVQRYWRVGASSDIHIILQCGEGERSEHFFYLLVSVFSCHFLNQTFVVMYASRLLVCFFVCWFVGLFVLFVVVVVCLV